MGQECANASNGTAGGLRGDDQRVGERVVRVVIHPHPDAATGGFRQSTDICQPWEQVLDFNRDPVSAHHHISPRYREIVGENVDFVILRRVELNDGAAAVPEVVHRLAEVNVRPGTISLSRPTLDDVFLAATGRRIEGGTPEVAA